MDCLPRRKPHRLPAYRYIGPLSVHFTINVEDRNPLFRDGEVVDKLLDNLESKILAAGCDAPVYCFMPDHLHLLVRGRVVDATPKEAGDRFKL